MELVQALRAYRELLGCENVLVDEATICAAQTATYATNWQVCAIIRQARSLPSPRMYENRQSI